MCLVCSPPERFCFILCNVRAAVLISWHVLQAPDCRIVLLVGLSLMVVPVVVMCCFNDDRSLGESSEAKRCILCSAHHTMACAATLRPSAWSHATEIRMLHTTSSEAGPLM